MISLPKNLDVHFLAEKKDWKAPEFPRLGAQADSNPQIPQIPKIPDFRETLKKWSPGRET